MASAQSNTGFSEEDIQGHLLITRAFLSRTDNKGPTRIDMKALKNFVTSDAERIMPHPDYLPADDVDRRRLLILQIHNECEKASTPQSTNPDPNEDKQSRLAICWSMLNTLGTAVLTDLLEQLERENRTSVIDTVPHKTAEASGKLVRIFLGLESSKSKKGDITRDGAQPNIVRIRDDYQCIVTGWSGTIEVCHIFPFYAINSVKKTKEALSIMSDVWGTDRVEALRRRLGYAKTQIIDTPANMVCMDRRVHKMWSRGEFALEPMDVNIDEMVEPEAPAPVTGGSRRSGRQGTAKVTKYGIQVRFHWLKRTTLQSPEAMADFTVHPSQIWRPDDGNPRLLDTNGRPIDSGHIIRIYAMDKTQLPDMDILQLQWDLLRMHALSGGADPSVYDSAFPDDDEDPDWLAAPAGGTSLEPLPSVRPAPAPSLRDVGPADFDQQALPASNVQRERAATFQEVDPTPSPPLPQGEETRPRSRLDFLPEQLRLKKDRSRSRSRRGRGSEQSDPAESSGGEPEQSTGFVSTIRRVSNAAFGMLSLRLSRRRRRQEGSGDSDDTVIHQEATPPPPAEGAAQRGPGYRQHSGATSLQPPIEEMLEGLAISPERRETPEPAEPRHTRPSALQQDPPNPPRDAASSSRQQPADPPLDAASSSEQQPADPSREAPSPAQELERLERRKL